MTFAPQIVEELSSSELCAHLRIIAADSGKLSAQDRHWITCAANEIEIAYRQLLTNDISMGEMIAKHIAMEEGIQALTPRASWSMGASVNVRFP